MLGKVALEKLFFLPVLSHVNIIAPILHIHLRLNTTMIRKTREINLGTFKHRSTGSDIRGSLGTELLSYCVTGLLTAIAGALPIVKYTYVC
jgi:hypothetical protein